MAVNEYGVDVDALRAESEDINRRTNRGSYWKPAIGKNSVRILPAKEEGQAFFEKVYGHWINSKKTSYLCLNKMKGEKCYFCEVAERLRDEGDKKAASNMSASVRYILQVIDRKEPEKGPMIFNAGATIFNAIISILSDEDYEKLLDLKVGYDLLIERVGEGLDTKYPSIRPRKDPSPAGTVQDKLLDISQTLTEITYPEMQTIYDATHSTESAIPAQGAEAVATAATPDANAVPAASEAATAPAPPATTSGKPECYKQYDADADKCKTCSENFECEIDTPAS